MDTQSETDTQQALPFTPVIYVNDMHHSLRMDIGEGSRDPKVQGSDRTVQFENGVLVLRTPEDVQDFADTLKHLERTRHPLFLHIRKTASSDEIAHVYAVQQGRKQGSEAVTGTLTSLDVAGQRAEVAARQDEQIAAAHGSTPPKAGNPFAALLAGAKRGTPAPASAVEALINGNK